jgi:hypothetical protein
MTGARDDVPAGVGTWYFSTIDADALAGCELSEHGGIYVRIVDVLALIERHGAEAARDALTEALRQRERR